MISETEILIRLGLAAFLGSIVGLERERVDWVAGLRTHMLVCVASALMMIVSIFGFEDILGREGVILDPSRVASSVITGIGFIGAGTIFFFKQQVLKGLTTSAGIWSLAGIGLAVGGGLFFAAFMATLIVLIILFVIQKIETNLTRNYKDCKINIVLEKHKFPLAAVEQIITDTDIKISSITFYPNKTEGTDQLELTSEKSIKKEDLLLTVERIKRLPGIREINF
jgi:putative Mg2+ transporter-C (MgtC) family protein